MTFMFETPANKSNHWLLIYDFYDFAILKRFSKGGTIFADFYYHHFGKWKGCYGISSGFLK